VGGAKSASTMAGVRTMMILPSRVRCSLSSEIKVYPDCWATAAYTVSAPRNPYWGCQRPGLVTKGDIQRHHGDVRELS
jgi:hypothetical protein